MSSYPSLIAMWTKLQMLRGGVRWPMCADDGEMFSLDHRAAYICELPAQANAV